MAYDSSHILCWKCLPQEIGEENLRAYLDGYAASLPDDLRAPEAEYAKRLAACEGCEHRIGFTCTLCGCYLQARAAKKRQKCPVPGVPRWGPAHDPKDEG